MKTPKEKAEDIYIKMLKWQDEVDKYIDLNIVNTTAKQCALIAVDQLIHSTFLSPKVLSDFDNYDRQYWFEVKTEINNL